MLKNKINKNRLVQTFLELVKIDSESGNEAGVRQYLENKLQRLGLETKIDATGNLFGYSKVETNLKSKKRLCLLFSAHMDTVKPGNGVKPLVKGDTITSSGDTILGSDDKSGLAEILEMLEVIKENNITTPDLTIAFSVEEEIGVRGVRAMKGLQADFGFVLDTDGPIGTVVIAAPSHEKFIIKVQGRAAHAGIEPEKGINAIVAASKAIAKLKVGKIDKDTVCNLGIISGGKATNIVPDEVIIHGEARSLKEEKVAPLVEKIKNIFLKECEEYGAKVIFTSTREYEAFNIGRNTQLLSYCKKAGKNIGVKTLIKQSCGGSDANFLNIFGIPTAVISSGMSKVHTLAEQVLISDMVKATEYILSIVQKSTQN